MRRIWHKVHKLIFIFIFDVVANFSIFKIRIDTKSNKNVENTLEFFVFIDSSVWGTNDQRKKLKNWVIAISTRDKRRK